MKAFDITHPEVIRLSEDGKSVIILDQTRLPNHEEHLTISDAEAAYRAIKLLQVRGAPAIGVFAGYAIYVIAEKNRDMDRESFDREFCAKADYLNSSRPTAVNLSWALNRMKGVLTGAPGVSVAEVLELLRKEAEAIDAENIGMTKNIAEHGAALLKDGDSVLTHCNAGYLACLGYGTATAPVYYAAEKGLNIKVFSDETRPLLQGARLTSYELNKAGIDVTVICDNMASIVMKQGKVDIVFVGADRIAANGDFANKIGTSGVAILAKHYGIPFYTLAPSSTIDFNTAVGEDIVIEERNADEIKEMWYKEPMAPADVKSFNPAFDVTDHELVTGIITERGIAYPPFDVNLKKLFE